MSELRVESWTMPAASIGPENPLPPLITGQDIHAAPALGPGVPEEIRRNIGYGRVAGCLPYTMQDGYCRERRPTAFRVAVLENEALRATFLLEFGGRLWSLVHKPSGRELLEVNPVFQPANLAIRNAWLSGGVEWNVGLRGHSPFTCSPLFAARVEGPGKTPVLRFYEWERIRQAPFQMDFYLPDGSPVLFVRIRIRNPHEREIPMYWWSNIAVPETPDTRVVVPADRAYRFGYEGRLDLAPIPEREGTDVTYSTNLNHSADFFFHVPDGHRPWIAGLDREGRGLVQTSTDLLKGRKLFLWGTGPGGKRWQEYLSVPGHAYIELQAGLARTQSEHVPMPARAEWAWLEAYGLMEADPAAVHGTDWPRAWQTVEQRLEELIPRAALQTEFEQGAEFVDRPPEEILQRGSGWGALERIRREAAGEPPFCSEALLFDDESLGPAQAPWLALLRDGEMPEADDDEAPSGWVVQPKSREMLEAAVRAPRKRGAGAHWLAWLHLGVMRYHAGEHDAARQAWETSVSLRRTPWALRNLAVVAAQDKRLSDAADLYLDAIHVRPGLVPLAVECGRALIQAKRPEDWLALLPELPDSVRAVGRIRLMEGQAALAAGDLDRVERLLSAPWVFEDVREGERSLSDLWFGLYERRLSAAENVPIDEALRARVRRDFPPPPEIDFRTST